MSSKERDDSERCTMFTFIENGRQTHRRVRRVMFQDRYGRPWHMVGKGLPEAVIVQTGEGFKGDGLLEIIEYQKQTRSRPAPLPDPASEALVRGRDVVYMVIGYITFSFVELIAHAL